MDRERPRPSYQPSPISMRERDPGTKTATAAGKAAWTAPFLLFTGQDRAISSVLPLYSKQGTLLGVFSVDIFLSQLNQFLSGFISEAGGVCFITDGIGSLIAASSSSAVAGRLTSETVKRVGTVFAAEARRGGFELNGERYFVNAAKLPESIGLDWVLFTAYPEASSTRS